jgi:hypothetical protein
MTLQEAKENIGRKVIYTPFEGCTVAEIEVGVITGVNSRFAMVRYGSDNWSKATHPNDLDLEVI